MAGDASGERARPAGRPKASRTEALEAENAALKQDLWTARDAAIGAIAQAGTLRARNAELEATVAQLHMEVRRLARVEESITFRVGDAVLKPLKVARRLTR
ncbi:MAG: hypothetical protein R2698_01865 [Microthrixaceae bacterium]